MKIVFSLVFISLLMIEIKAQRYRTEIFTQADTMKNIQYGSAINIKGQQEHLLSDIYSPHQDQLVRRPLVIFLHGGGFTGGDKAVGYPLLFAEGLVKRGYVVASINYRLGMDSIRNDTLYFEAMVRAAQDAKTSVRFFRKYARKFGIDTHKIYIMGGSAGAHAILHLAYLDEGELPSYWNSAKLGSWSSGQEYQDYSSKVYAVINCWGALIDYHWIKKGDIPLFSIHGVEDKLVPIDSSDITHGFKYGSRVLYQQQQRLGIYSRIKIYENTGHTLDSDKAKQKEALNAACLWLYEIVTGHKK